MSYSDEAIITLTIQAQDASATVVDDAVGRLDELTDAGGAAGQALLDLQSTGEDALSGVSGAVQQVVDDAGEIGPAFEDATDSVDTSGAIDALEELGDEAANARDGLASIATSTFFDNKNMKAIKNAAEAFDNIAGTDLKPLAEGLDQIADITEPFEKQITAGLSGVLGKLGGKLAPAGAAAGAVIGEAQAVGQQGAATGTTAVSGMFSKIAAMSVPLAPAGTTVGIAVGGAIQAGFILGLAGLAVAGAAAIANITVGGATDWMNTGKKAAETFLGGYSEEVQQRYAQVVQQAFSDASHHRMPYQQARAAGLAAGAAYLESVGLAITDSGPAELTEATAAFMGSIKVSILDHQDDIAEAMGNVIEVGVVDVIHGAEDAAGDAMDDLMYAIEHPLEGLAKAAEIQGQLTSAELAAGLASGNEWVRAQAEATKAILMEQYRLITGHAYDSGYDAQAEYARGLAQFRTPRQLRVDWPGAPSRFGGKYLPGDIGRAHGGPTGAGGIYEVTEYGDPEMLSVGGRNFLLMGNQDGYVDPIGRGSVSRGGGAVVNLNVSFSTLTPPTAAEGQRMAEALVPPLVDELRRQQIL